ncbi:hypothetical protein DFH11DRAFT_1802648 [Phellopilus nigrolimitatus]|nr:hypothetical protein DFH11DRAFT_1802648 [Phellopilus nigrolimitatus]
MSSSDTSSEPSWVYITSPDNRTDSGILPREHEYFNFKDGNITFLVENTLFTIHQYFLVRESPTMRSMFARARFSNIANGTKEKPIKLWGTDSLDFERFLMLFYPPKFGEDSLTSSYEWCSALRIANKYEFANIRKLATLKLLTDASCSERLLLGQRYNVRFLTLTGFRDICNRNASLSLEEVRSFNTEDIALIMRCREDLLTRTSTRRSFIDDDEVESFFASRLPPSEPELDITENPPSSSSQAPVSRQRVPRTPSPSIRARSTTPRVISPPPRCKSMYSQYSTSDPFPNPTTRSSRITTPSLRTRSTTPRTPSPPAPHILSPTPPCILNHPLPRTASPSLSYRSSPPRSPPPCIPSPPPPRTPSPPPLLVRVTTPRTSSPPLSTRSATIVVDIRVRSGSG